MKVHVLFAQRIQRYKGQYGLEALAVMTEYDYDENPSYLMEKKRKQMIIKNLARLKSSNSP